MANAPALDAWRRKRDLCIEEDLDVLDVWRTRDIIWSVVEAAGIASQSLIKDLSDGGLTYGDFARRRQSIADISADAIAAIQAELQKKQPEARVRAGEISLRAEYDMNLAELGRELDVLKDVAVHQPEPVQRLAGQCDFGRGIRVCF